MICCMLFSSLSACIMLFYSSSFDRYSTYFGMCEWHWHQTQNMCNFDNFVIRLFHSPTITWNVCWTGYLELYRISSGYHYLSEDATKTVVCALILFGLDYCNAVHSRFPKHSLGRLQKVQNNAACLICWSSKFSHVSCHAFSSYTTLASNWEKEKKDWFHTAVTMSYTVVWRWTTQKYIDHHCLSFFFFF